LELPVTISKPKEKAFAILFVRLILGLTFVQAGIYKIFELGPIEHAKKYFLVEPYLSSFLPLWLLYISGIIIPIVELIAGSLVLIGFRAREALVALGVILVVVTFGHLLADPFFDLHRQIFVRLSMIIFLLMFSTHEDFFSFDALRSYTRNKK